MKILVVGNEEVTTAMLRRTLSAMGQEVTVAGDGLRAWKMLQEEHFRLIISDESMPKLDGLSLCRRVRRLNGRPYTYVILCTDGTSRADRIEGLRAGADDLVVKPIDAEELALRLEVAQRILTVHARLEQANGRLVELATTDELTGLVNRREFHRAFEMNMAMALRLDVPLSLMLLDIDRFKEFNDTFGHPAGDAALRGFAETVRASSRHYEPVGRLGGEEFGIVLYDTTGAAARTVAQRIREALARREWPHRPLTASYGAATIGPSIRTVTQLIERADLALYDSKRRGRDCFTHCDDRVETLLLGG
jgi:diguanylate cyclase (GGDEF)-like protein